MGVIKSLFAFMVLYNAGCHANIIVFQGLPIHEIIDDFRDMPARFGERLPARGLKGYLVVASPRNACTPIEKPPSDVENFTGRWIVLIERYNCSFEEKVRNAQNASYDAAIVYNVNSNDLEQMSAKDADDVLIPSVFVGYSDGMALAAEYTYDKYPSYYLVITNDLPFDINTHLLLPFVLVVAICMFIMLVFMIIKCIKDRRRQRRYRLPSSSLNKIPTCKFNAKNDPYETCAICLDDYIDGEKLRVLPCAHAYHCKCIDPWLTKNRRVCPVCKRKVFAHDERPEPDSDSDSDAGPPRQSQNASDTTPLLGGNNSSTAARGSRSVLFGSGTFRQQRENPFQYARRAFSQGAVTNNTYQQNHERSNHPNYDEDSLGGGGSITSASSDAMTISSVGSTRYGNPSIDNRLLALVGQSLFSENSAANSNITSITVDTDHQITTNANESTLAEPEVQTTSSAVMNFFRKMFVIDFGSASQPVATEAGNEASTSGQHSINNDYAEIQTSVSSVRSQYEDCHNEEDLDASANRSPAAGRDLVV